MQQSEVARLREQIEAEYVAAKRALTGLASGTARHVFITHRMEHLGLYHSELVQLVGEHEATKIVVEAMEKY